MQYGFNFLTEKCTELSRVPYVYFLTFCSFTDRIYVNIGVH